MGTRHWPLFDLVVETPRLTLRYVDDDLAVELIELAGRGIHDPATMPFSIPWTDLPSPRFERESLQFYWGRRAGLQPDDWSLQMAVIVDGVTVGLTDLLAKDFPRIRGVATGSWLGREFQGRGIGKEMRIATLTLGFDGLGAEYATTGAFHDNEASKGVTTLARLRTDRLARHAPARRARQAAGVPHVSRALADDPARRHHDRRSRALPRPARRVIAGPSVTRRTTR